MWFGTPDGLCRYDGSVLTPYKYAATYPNEPINNFVRGKIHEDKQGNIWYSNETGIYKWDAFKQKIVNEFPIATSTYGNIQFFIIQMDKEENLWLVGLPIGIAKYNIRNRQLTFFPLPKRVAAAGVEYTFFNCDNDGNIWMRIVTSTESFLKFSKATLTFAAEYTSDPPHAIIFAKNKKVLAYDDRLVFEGYNNQVIDVIPKMIDGKKTSFFSFTGLVDSHHRIWMTARGGGLFYYNEEERIFHQYHHDNSKIKSLPFDLTTCLFIDRSDNLWIGIDGGGVAKIDLKQPKFNLFPLSEGDYPVLNDYFTKCFFEDDKKRIWFGSHNNGFSIYDPVTTKLINYRNNPSDPYSLPGNSVAGFYQDSKHNMWIVTNSGLAIFSEASSTFKTIPINNLPNMHPQINLFAYKIIEQKNGDFLVATIIGLVRVKANKSGNLEGYYFGGKNFLSCTTTDMIEMDDKTLFATMPGSGLYHLKETEHDYDSIKSYFRGTDLRSVRRDAQRKHIIWIASGKGLIEFNTVNEQFKLWDEKTGIANSYVYGSLEDEKHNLWISTNGGLSYLDKTSGHIDNYSYQDGLQSNEFNTQSFYKSRTNTFYFGGIKGFNWFQSKTFETNYHKPQAAITRLEVNNASVPFDSAFLLHHYVQLTYDENDLNFKFAALDYTRPEANKIQYKLAGWDVGWITTYNRSARYSNMPPGEYVFTVRASNAAGIWSDEQRMKIIIRKPFWNQQWFYALIIFFFVLMIVLVTYAFFQDRLRKQLRKLEKQAAIDIERNRISKDMHDEIGNGLTHIALLSELIKTQHDPSVAIKKDISAISVSAGKLVQSMSEIIWALSPQNDTLENLMAYIREQSQQYFEGMNVHFNIDFPDVSPNIKLTNEQRRNLFLVTKEALSNAMKHAQATCIHLSLTEANNRYCFNVRDNGVGITGNKQKVGSNGLKNMKKRMDDIGGTIEWINESTGTRVEYCLALQ
jgi:signal transduction histidine kinase/ligand-binding sensor domain-containing protein